MSNLDLDRRYKGTEVLHEDLQDQTIPMVVVGSDVISLYPNLDIRKVGGAVKEAVIKTDVKWEEIDYLEGARYVALNWSEEQCRASKLGRILLRRRKSGGTRPGLRGAGFLGGERGTFGQEQ